MTPKEKAKALIDRFFIEVDSYNIIDFVSQLKAKKCALICIDEMIKTAAKGILPSEFPTKEVLRLKEVKKEINKL